MAGIDNLLEVMGFPIDADVVEKDNCAQAATNLITNMLSVMESTSVKINSNHQFYQHEKNLLSDMVANVKNKQR